MNVNQSTIVSSSFNWAVDLKHYANIPMQYTAKFDGCKNDNFHMKNCDTFLIFAQNIGRGYTLEPPHLFSNFSEYFV